ncbi:hypothetical protein [Mucilaginibacter sp.]|uniref:hypothetical protein n=1 Tax=Mucilaginibacter sp. TaxID=1882438 RepID=UPI003D0FD5BB
MSIFIAQLFPKNKVVDIKGASQAGINFCFNFIDAIQPTHVYAYQLSSVTEKLAFDFENDKIEYIASRSFPNRSVFKALNILAENFKIIFSIIKRGENNIWFYNLTPQVILIYSVLRLLFRKKCFIVLADFTPELFRNKVALQLMRYSNGVISLSFEAKDMIGSKVSVIVKPGILGDLPKQKSIRPIQRNNFLFSGSLSKYTGIELALQTFSNTPSLNLFISGIGESEQLINEYAAKYPNITYCGYLSFQEYVKVLDSVDFVLSLRDVSMGRNKYNFPSKIIEYFLHEKIVVSTKSYPTLDADVYFCCDYDEPSLKELLLKINQLSDDNIRSVQTGARNFAIDNLSNNSWATAVSQLESTNK